MVESVPTGDSTPKLSTPALARPFGPGETLCFAWLGTAVAGGLFPVVFLLASGASELLGPPSRLHPENLWMAFPAFLIGFLYAGLMGLIVALAGGLFAALTQIRGAPIWLASLVGGWTGFVCTVLIGANFSINPAVSIGLATLMGQAGAATAAALGVRRNPQLLGMPKLSEPLRLSLRQLFGATTAVCLMAALVGAANPSSRLYGWIAAAAVLQGITLGLATAYQRWRRSPLV